VLAPQICCTGKPTYERLGEWSSIQFDQGTIVLSLQAGIGVDSRPLDFGDDWQITAMKSDASESLLDIHEVGDAHDEQEKGATSPWRKGHQSLVRAVVSMRWPQGLKAASARHDGPAGCAHAMQSGLVEGPVTGPAGRGG
jgi:hypothetical protein